MTKNDGKRGEYEVYREIIAWDYQGLQHHFSRGGQNDGTDDTLDLVVEKRLDRRAGKEACLDVRESKMRRREGTLYEWQRRWWESTKGRETFQYLPKYEAEEDGELA